MYGYRYRYPRRGRKAKVETFIKPDDREAWAKAAIFNRASVSRNPWIRFLEDRGVYEQISKLLRDAKLEYNKQRPPDDKETQERKKKALERRMQHLEEELGILKYYQSNPSDLLPVYSKKKFATEVPYQQAVVDEIEKLENELRRLKGEALVPTQRESRIQLRRQALKEKGLI
jgi:chaperonin cofactor prefoldin